MERITVRLSKEENRMLKEMSEKAGMTDSDSIRDMIRASYERHSVADALREIRAAISKVAAQKNGDGSSEDLAEIKRIVTLIGMAMPSVAKHIKPATG